MHELKKLDETSTAIQYLTAKDKHLAKAIKMVGPLDYYLESDGYAFLISQIIGQMLSNKVADVLTQRMLTLCHGQICLNEISALTDEEIHEIGLSRPKVGYIRNLTTAIKSGTIDFTRYKTMTDTEIITDLTTIKGIGNWSAKMYLIFSLDRPDILPFEDIAFLQGFGWLYKTDDFSMKVIQKKCQKWHPYSSIAARYMYRALDLGLTKKPFHLFK